MTTPQDLNTLSQQDFAALTADQIKQLTPAQLAALDLPHCQWLNAAQTAALSNQQIAAMSPAQVASMTALGSLQAYAGLTGAQVSALSNQQISSLGHIDWLTAAGSSGLTAAQIPSISIAWKYMGAAWLNGLTPAAIAVLPVSAWGAMTTTTLQGLSTSFIGAMSNDQLCMMTAPQSLSTDAAAARNAALGPWATIDWTTLTADWINSQSAAVVAKMPLTKVPAAVINGLTVSTVAALTSAQLGVSNAAMSFSTNVVASLTPAQVGAIRNWSGITGAWMNALTPAARGVLPNGASAALSKNEIGKLTAATVATMTPAQIGALGYLDWLTSSALAVVTPAQIRALTPAQVGKLWYPQSLSAAAAGALTPEQVQAITTNWANMPDTWVNALQPSTLAAIAPANIALLRVATLGGLSAATVAAMTLDQTAKLPAASLSAACIAGFSPAQMGVLAAASLPTAAVAALSAAQVNAIPGGLANVSAAWINALSRDTMRALSVATIATIPVADISGLTSATMVLMTAAQLAALPSPELLSTDAAATRNTVLNGVDYATVTAAWLNAQTPAAIAAIAASDIAKLSVATLQGISATTVRALSTTQISALTSPQSLALAAVPALTAAQTAAMGGDWNGITGAWVNALTPQARAALPTAVPAAMTNKEMWNLTAATVGSMTPAQVSAFRYMDWLTSSVVAVLSPDHIRALTPAQVGKIYYPQALNAAAVGTLTPAQVAAIGTNWPNMSNTWLSALQPQSLAAIAPTYLGQLSAATIGALPAATVGAMTNDQLAALASPDLLTPAAAAVRNAALGPWATVDWTTVTPDWINGQTPAVLAAMPTTKLTSTLIAALSPSTVAALSARQIGALSAPISLPLDAVAALSPTQIRAITAWSGCSAAWVGALSPEAIKVVPTSTFTGFWYTQVKVLTGATIANMTPDQVVALRFKDWLTNDAVAALKPEQVAAMSGTDINALTDPRYLTPAVFAVLTPDQIQVMNKKWGSMSTAQVTAIQPDTFAALSPACVAQLSWSSVAALSAETVHAMTIAQITACTQIGSLSANGTQGLRPEAITAMTAAQIAALDHPGALSPACVAALSAEQVAAIPDASPFPWSTVDGSWFRNLSSSAFGSVPFDRLGAATVRSFDANLVSRMSADQVAALVNPGWIPNAVAATLRPDQLRTTIDLETVSAAWLNSLSPQAFAAIPAAGVNQMSLAALQGLDATRRAIALQSADTLHAGYLGMASADATLNYDTVLAALQKMAPAIGANGLSEDQFAAINDLMNRSKAANGGPSYVSALLGNMIKRGVAVNASADTFTASVNKWFLGTDNPIASDYTNVDDLPLFKGTTQGALSGIDQGGLGDCWLISPLAALAEAAPERLNGLISANGNGTYCVKFFNENDSDPVFLTVDGKVANFGAGTGMGSWQRLIENAWVEARSSGLIAARSSVVANDYSVLRGGYDDIASRVLVGGGRSLYNNGGVASYDALVKALQNNDNLVTYLSFKNSTGADGMTNLVSSHVFAVLGVNPDNGKLIFQNPWASHLTFELSAEELDAVPGSGSFAAIKIGKEYGASTVQAPVAQTMSASSMDLGTGSLVQAMSSFDVPLAVTTTPTVRDSQNAQVAILTPH